MDTPARAPLARALVANAVLAMLLRFAVLLYPPAGMLQSHLFALLPVMLVVPVLRLPQARRQKGLALCACLFVWIVVSCLAATYVDSDLYTVLTPFFLTLIFLFVTCYPMAFVLERESMRRAFTLVATVFVFCMTALCAVGDYVALANAYIPSPGGPAYQAACILDHRLAMFCSSVATGSFSCVTVLLCLLLLLDRPRPALRVLYILCIPIAYVAAALSDARIPIVFSSICIGGLVWLFAMDKLPCKRSFTRIAASLCLAGAVILAAYFGTGLCIQGANAASAAIAARAPSASAQAAPVDAPAAEAAAAPEAPVANASSASDELAKRPLLYRISSLNGRTDVWLSAIELFRHDPIKLVTGTSPVFIIRDTQPYLSPDALNDVYPHMHSLPFQTVTAFGLPGLILYAALILYVCYHALRVFFMGAGVCTLFERGVALIPLFYSAMDFVDISLWFAPPSSFTVVWFYLAGGYAVYLSTTRIPSKRRALREAAQSGKEANV